MPLMNAGEISRELEEVEKSVCGQQQRLLDRRRRIVDALKPFIREQLKETVEAEVRSRCGRTMELGKPELSGMKERLGRLIEDSGRIVEETFRDDGLWADADCSARPGGDPDGQRAALILAARNKIDGGVAAVLGEAGRLLIDYGYLPEGGVYVRDGGRTRTDAETGKTRCGLVSRAGFTLPPDARARIEEYCCGLELLYDTLRRRLALQQRLSEQEAAELWEKA